MTLEQLLKLLREGILNDRSDRVAGTSDFLWTDETLVLYINEAQRRFAVKGLVLRDGSTDEVTKVELVQGQTEYPLSDLVIAVISAQLEHEKLDLKRVGHSTLNAYSPPTDHWTLARTYQGMPPGPTIAYATDGELSDFDSSTFTQPVLRVFPEPGPDQAGDIVRLRVVRKPLQQLTPSALSAVPEIPEDHHIEMLDWAAYLALRIVDDDAGAPRRAEEFRQMFEEHVKAARVNAMKKLFAPIGWGFGRGGFTWES